MIFRTTASEVPFHRASSTDTCRSHLFRSGFHIMKANMSYQNILLQTKDRISILTINRPDKRNALNQATRDEILHALDFLRESAESRILIVTGAGDKSFIAGADIGEFEGRTALTQRESMKARRIF